MITKGPLNLPEEAALKIEREILALQPFPRVLWEDAIERYLILRWVLGLRPASVREITDALIRAKFWRAVGRSDSSCRGTVYRVFDNWNHKFRVRGGIWISYNPRLYAWRPTLDSGEGK